MRFTKPKEITYEEIAETSGVSTRTIKRYASGGNVTTANAVAISEAVEVIRRNKRGGRSNENVFVPESQKEFLFRISMFKHNLFWSSPIDKVRNIDGTISTYVKSPNLHDIHLLVRLFGSRRVLSIAKTVYQSVLEEFGMPKNKLSTLPEYQTVIRMVNYSMRAIR
ncbi:MAG: hypothetical protein PHT07_10105 [Paludibacter sp.]|nr:hypothetical protein [Paludibacter sp.]